MIEVENLTVRFGGVIPLSDVSVTFASGTCGLIGPNGAGKTTFLNVLSGFVKPAKGAVRAFGDDLLRMADFRRARWGLRRTFQQEQSIENLQKIYGYYLDRRMWDEVADLFADNGTIEMGQRGVYVGKPRVRQFLNLLGPVGIKDGELFDHVQLQVVVDVAADGRTAKSRSRELNMIGVVDGEGTTARAIDADDIRALFD